MAMVSLTVLLILVVLSVAGPLISPYTYSDQIRGEEGLGPSLKHPCGTDTLGRDMFVRILYGARISLGIGVAAALINLVIGVIYGAVSGYFGGITDNIMMRIIDIFYSIPLMLYVILLMVVLKGRDTNASHFGMDPSLTGMFLAIGLVYWIRMARIVRGQVLSLKQHDYITASKALGATNFWIITRHLIPNCAGPIIVTAVFQIPSAIFTEAFLSFIGLGVDAPMASWGSLAADGLGSMRSYFHLMLFPSLAICFTILAFNLLGDGLKGAFQIGNKKPYKGTYG